MPAVIELLYKTFFSWRRDQHEDLAGITVADLHRNQIYEGEESRIFTRRARNNESSGHRF